MHASFSEQVPDLHKAEDLSGFFAAIQQLIANGQLLAYHDRSDGGLITSVCEMAFAGRCGLSLSFKGLSPNDTVSLRAKLFAEEAGAIIPMAESQLPEVLSCFAKHGLQGLLEDIGKPVTGHFIEIEAGDHNYLRSDLRNLHQVWSETSFAIQKLRDHPDCAEEEFEHALEWESAYLRPELTFDPQQNPLSPQILTGVKPSVAILREQGVNGQIERAAAVAAGREQGSWKPRGRLADAAKWRDRHLADGATTTR